MTSFKTGDRVKVKEQASSRHHGRLGTVVRTEIRGLAVTYQLSFDQTQVLPTTDNRFFEYDLETVASH